METSLVYLSEEHRASAMNHFVRLSLAFACIGPIPASAQTTLIPDMNFEQALIDLGYDSGTPDGSIPTANIDQIGSLDVSYRSIGDLTGIESFTSLEHLNCSLNFLITLDLSQNIGLTRLDLSSNWITNLDLAQNTALTFLSCGSNPFTDIDLSQNVLLDTLMCVGSQVSILDLSQNVLLRSLYCNDSQISSVNVTHCPLLNQLWCNSSMVTSLDVTQNPALELLYCSHTPLIALDLSASTSLRTLNCTDAALTSLDLSQNNELRSLWCGECSLTNLDLSQNINLGFVRCDQNQLTQLILPASDSLRSLDCASNLLPGLFLGDLDSLRFLNCENNQLATLDLSNNPELRILSCQGNSLSDLDLHWNSRLFGLWFFDNPLTCLNVKNGGNTHITTFSGQNNPLLFCIEVDDPAWSSSHWFAVDDQVTFSEDCANACSFVGIEEGSTNRIACYPNPTSSRITISLPPNLIQPRVWLHNALGESVPIRSTTETDHIDLVINAPAGIYVLNLKSITEPNQSFVVVVE